MPIKIGVLMDPIQQINFKKDTTLALLFEAQRRGWIIHYIEQSDVFLTDGNVYARSRQIKVFDDEANWFAFGDERIAPLKELDVILMRKDPPFDMEYIFTTHLLELAEAQGVLVVNKPQSLRDASEKLFTGWFPQCCPETLVSRDQQLIYAFLQDQREIVLKPLGNMGGTSVFHVRHDDVNSRVIIETLTGNGNRFVMAQRFIADIFQQGDKRILLIDGKPIPYALARIPMSGDFRGNLAVGASSKGVELTKRDQWICEQVGPVVKQKGLLFVGIDVIGDYLTEINVTSPTGLRQLDHYFHLNISAQLFDVIAAKISRRK